MAVSFRRLEFSLLVVVLVSAFSVWSVGGASAASSKSTKKAPYQFMLISATGSGTPEADLYIEPGAIAAIDSINASGGVNGHKIKMDFCDSQGNATVAGECATFAVDNPNILATVGDNNYTGGSDITPVLQKAGMAAIDDWPLDPTEYSSPVVFPAAVGSIGFGTGGVELVGEAGLKNILFVGFDTASSEEALTGAESTALGVLKNLGDNDNFLTPVMLPPTATDMSSYAATAISENPSGIVLSLGSVQALAFMQSMRQLGYTGSMLVSAAVVPATEVQQVLGSSAGQIMGLGYYNFGGPDWKLFTSQLSKYQPSAALVETDVNSWLGVRLFAQVLKSIKGTPTRAKVLAKMRTISAYNTGGLSPVVNFTKPSTVPNFPRLFNPTVVGVNYSNGAYTDEYPTTPFVNIYTGAKS
jgi:ABC-type branched-subunit amino acid transport system substrate-binding protein